MYTYRTDSIHCDTPFPTERAATTAAIADGEWAQIDSPAERSLISDGGWLCVYESGVPLTIRGTMP